MLIPTSKDPAHPRQDPVGAVLSIVGLCSLLYAIIDGPVSGWTSPRIVGAFVVAAVVLGGFAWWESHVDHPMLDTNFFKNPRFTAASSGITLVFFAMFGATFLLTEYLQFTLNFSPLGAGLCLLPWAGVMMVTSASSARDRRAVRHQADRRDGTRNRRRRARAHDGLPVNGHYVTDVMWRMMLMAAGMGLVMAPATDSIMGSLPLGKAGVGSAVNDTTRQVGGALGVAIIGSVMSSVYQDRVASRLGGYAPAAPRPCRSAARSVARSRSRSRRAGTRVRSSRHRRRARSSTDCTSPCSSVPRPRSSVRSSRPSGCRPARRRAASSRSTCRRSTSRSVAPALAESCSPGRPRSVACDEAILRAALDEYAARGYDGLSVDAVAARAGVSKATIYRRYQGKTDLVLAAAAAVVEDSWQPPTSDDLRTVLRAVLDKLRRAVRK